MIAIIINIYIAWLFGLFISRNNKQIARATAKDRIVLILSTKCLRSRSSKRYAQHLKGANHCSFSLKPIKAITPVFARSKPTWDSGRLIKELFALWPVGSKKKWPQPQWSDTGQLQV